MISANVEVEKKLPEETIGEMVAKDFRKAQIFKKYGIDFCCRGNITIDQVCENKKIDAAQLKKELKEIENIDSDETVDYNSWALDELADYIVNKHHKYVEESIPVINEFGTKVCRVHGERHPELIDIFHYYTEVAKELTMHMHKEEMILFPYIKQLYQADKQGAKISRPGFGTIKNPINMMELEHISAGSNMDEVKRISSNFTPPENACATYTVFFLKLKEFENDLHHHIHLENNILFKKAIELEDRLF